MLSICIPTYNTPVTNLVLELISQSEKSLNHYEILILNDGSTCEVNNLYSIEPPHNPKVLFINSNDNIGRTAARNYLSQKATYNWLLFLDADVLPKNKNFLESFSNQISPNLDIISGGIAYVKEKPVDNTVLRWEYGRKREESTAPYRQENPYFLVSANLLIKKDVFNDLNPKKIKGYGLDNIFSYRAFQKQIRIKHIDNPVLHLGLEPNRIFLKKSLKAIDTLIQFEIDGKVSNDFTKLQKVSKSIIRLKLQDAVITFIDWFLPKLKNNILSKNPSLIVFDIYRLHYYLKKKKEKRNA